MAQTTEGVSESVEAVSFSFLTDEEVRRHSVVKVTNSVLLDNVGRPVAEGLYDPAMGTLDERTACKSCGQRSFHCPGHCGHIDLVCDVYNPLLFNTLYTLLKRTCFFCLHFRESRSQVNAYVSKLELIAKGDVVSAKELDAKWLNSSLQKASDGSDMSDLTGTSDPQHDGSKHQKQGEWTSLQFSEAMSVLNKFLKPTYKECKNCKAKNPAITKPTFGWLRMSGMTGAQTRGNIIRGKKLDGPFLDGVGKGNLSEMESSEGVVLQDDAGNEAETQSSTFASLDSSGIAKKGHRRKGQRLSEEYMKQKKFFSGPLLPSEVKTIMEHLWKNEARLCSFISDIQQRNSGNRATHSMFFLEAVLVPPIKFRPPSKGGDSVMEHPQTVLLGKLLQANISLGNVYNELQCATLGNTHNIELLRTTVISRWMDLQQSISLLFDSKTATGQGRRDVAPGICQLLEKKEGLFRQNMMGKRVNYACRSVISPDPYLAVNEIGIPPYFALRLTYPERVTPWNIVSLRKAIINGTEIHPGATHYVDKLSTLKLPPARRRRISISRSLPSSRGVVTQAGKSSENEFEEKIVYRHLRDGDIVLVNRQPTLHKPSIMAHVVRVLKGEKTLRMHYANCSTYNADFDGDEMNVHFPQDDISRAEAYNIVNANNQYVKPTNGSPIRALIQDHIVSAAILTKKDTFLNYDQFNHLLYSSGVSTAGSGSFRKLGKKVAVDFEENLLCPVPTIWKPEPLWTGKQLIAAVLDHLTRGCPPFTVEKQGKIPSDFFKRRYGGKIVQSEPGKEDAIKHKPSKRKGNDKDKVKEQDKPREPIQDNTRKNQEPGEDTVLILKNYLICGVIDKAQFGDYGLVHTVQELYGSNTAGILLSAFSRLFTAFLQMHGFTCGVDDLLLSKDIDEKRQQQLEECERCGEEVHCEVVGVRNIDPAELQLKIEEIIRDNGDSALTNLDRRMISKLNELSSKKIEKNLLSEGLFKPTGKNCISLMTTSGAKGGTANFQQISSHLGQQELEGRRVPRMVSGKTLPCFPSWDWASRAGGFIIDRFLTGLRPQEYYFHCMAGREGLVDTAVKTSRSGYLQRCLVKNLECLKVSYDHTVRDADGSIVQFYYGEDGVDVHKTSFVAKFDALLANHDIMKAKHSTELCKSNSYITDLPAALKDKADRFVCDMNLSVPRLAKNEMLKPEDFMKSVEQKYFSSLAQPGEPVGVVAAQSVGEPSTQMTLNTFHHAGRGEMNVTLGIPRLQEILMTASTDIKTPIMTCPLWRGRSKKDATSLAEKLKKITVAEMIEIMEVAVVPFAVDNHQVCSIYKLKVKLKNPKFGSVKHCEEILEVVYLRELEDAIQNHLLLLSKISGIKKFTPDSRPNASSETNEDASGLDVKERNLDDDAEDGDNSNDIDDLDSDGQKHKRQASDEMEYEDSSEEERNEPELSAGLESEVDQADEVDIGRDDDGTPGIAPEVVSPSKPKKSKEKAKSEDERKNRVRTKVIKDFDRAIFVAANGLEFEVHFKFIDEPHILLAQIAQKVAKKVYLRSSGKIESCQVTTCKENQVIYYGEDPKRRQKIEAEEKDAIQAIHTNGADFCAFWQRQDDLDIRYVYTNDIHAMLTTYGVEAARETIIREVQNVFGSYGISVDVRHLTLIADYMTHTGGYRPMNRLGGIAESISPFSKMSFETASKFIVDGAYHGAVDNLETPSARVCLGLPVKMGTGSFELLHKLEL